MMEDFARLQDRIANRDVLIGVKGLGYVGLPLAARAARVGFRVLGFDVIQERIDQIMSGESYVGDVLSADLAPLVADGFFAATTDDSRLGECDV
ncbi:MAG TPA: NAD(P)-binding domain-containing protein, partial [Herpetosiphonaceae bacterium]